MTILELVPDKFIVDELTGCWLYTGPLNKKGYGEIYYNHHKVHVHRLSAFLSGIILDWNDKTIHALHKKECPNKHCGNFEHLYAGTNSDNQRDMYDKGHIHHRKFLTQCKYGHPLEGENLYIAKDGRRRCNECRRRNARQHHHKL